MKDSKKLNVSAIKDGTVIDHIPAENLFKVLSILDLKSLKSKMTFGTNMESNKLGLKAIIKVSDKYFEDDEINKIALVAPEAKLNIINNYKVIEKKVVEIPNEVVGIVKCVNPKCITNNDEIVTRFNVVEKSKVALKCHYCEKITDQEHMKIIK
ncbi:MAG: aspartate carbamoyltransferase regulatory subunit [Chlorobi bacterium]|nr:aspartate carbamoyltransferase regulatory subunit [Chlorobiota bacterium]